MGPFRFGRACYVHLEGSIQGRPHDRQGTERVPLLFGAEEHAIVRPRSRTATAAGSAGAALLPGVARRAVQLLSY